MMKSMTAYAVAEKTENGFSVSVEIRSYNSRYLDISLRMPRDYSCLEEKIKGLLSEGISRGRIEICLRILDSSDDVYAYEVDEPKAKAYHKALVRLKDILHTDARISIDILAGIDGIIRHAEVEKDIDVKWPVIRGCVGNAIDELNEMREREGNSLGKDMASRLNLLEKSIDTIEKESDGLLAEYQERLKDRVKVLTRETVEIDQDRIAQEAAFLADRSDISEEIVRAKSHIKQFREIMYSKEPAGRKLNFLLQEFNREVNTMGSKSGKSSISHIVVNIKSELEKIREQVQNIE